MTKTCQWVDDEGNACTHPAMRKWCGYHRAAAAAARQASYRERQAAYADAAQSGEAPVYIPRNSLQPGVQSGRTMPRPHDVPARQPRISDESEVIDYSQGGLPRSSIYDRKPDTVPADAGRDFVRAAKIRAGGVDPAKATSLEWFAELAELGEEEFIRAQNRRRLEQQNEPHRFDFYFDAPWRQGYADPSTPDQMDAPWR